MLSCCSVLCAWPDSAAKVCSAVGHRLVGRGFGSRTSVNGALCFVSPHSLWRSFGPLSIYKTTTSVVKALDTGYSGHLSNVSGSFLRHVCLCRTSTIWLPVTAAINHLDLIDDVNYGDVICVEVSSCINND